jgi:hypothetical protein
MERTEVILILTQNGWKLLTGNQFQEIYHYQNDNDMLPVPKRPKIVGEQLKFILKVVKSKK